MARTNPKIELDRLVQTLGDAQAALDREQRRLQQKEQKARAGHVTAIAELEKIVATTEAAIAQLVREHRESLAPEGKVDGLVAGTVKIVSTPERVEIEDEEGVIAWLKKNRLSRYLRTKVTIDRNLLKRDRDRLPPDLDGVAIVAGEQLVITPATTNQDRRVRFD